MRFGDLFKIDREEDLIRQAIRETDGNEIPLSDKRLKSVFTTLLYLGMGILFFILMWWTVSAIYNTYWMYSLRFPTPGMVFERIVDLFLGNMLVSGETIYVHILSSLKRWILGFIIGFSIGLTIGIALSSNTRLYDFGMVPVSIWQMVPSLAWLPITILLFGFGDNSAIFIISASVIAPIAINIANGLRRTPPVYGKMRRMTEKSWSIWTLRVTIPHASLDLVAGLRIGMANGWRTLISAEMVIGVMIGLGYTIDASSQLSSYTTAFACIVIICIIGILIDRVVLANIEKSVRRRSGLEES